MSTPGIGTGMAVSRLRFGAWRARASSRLRETPLLRWSLMRARADELLLVPSDLRPVDPSFLEEVRAGAMGLAGMTQSIGSGSPFAVPSPVPAWERELCGFGWLGNLRAAGGDDARHGGACDLARRLVLDWCRRNRGTPGSGQVAGAPEVVARRVMSWLANSGFLLEGADADFYRAFSRTLGADLRALDGRRGSVGPGPARLVCAMALVTASLCVAGHDRERGRLERALLDELGAQILGDGGHISRNGEVVLDLLLDLLPIRQCFLARGLVAPARLEAAIERMVAFLWRMSTGAGWLARCNGVGVARADALATVLAIYATRQLPGSIAPGPSGYARLEQGHTVVVVDCGGPPPIEHAGAAHAGCLSFELAHDGEMVLVNAGAPGAAHRRAAGNARATASHTTLTLGEESSGRLVRSPGLERLIGGPAIAGPDTVTAELVAAADSVRLEASHDGYLGRTGALHRRRLTLSADGRRLDGEDQLGPPRGTLRVARDVPFAIRFHIAEGAAVDALREDSVVVRVSRGAGWRLTVVGHKLSIEGAADYAQSTGPQPSRQVVIRGASAGEASVVWRLEQLEA